MTTLKTEFKENTNLLCFADSGAVNPDAGEIKNISVMTRGEAKGHGMKIDEKTLSQLIDLLLGQSVPAYLTHDGASWGDRVTNEIGIFSGFFREGEKIKGNFKALNSFKKHNEKEFDTLFEIAEKMPDNFGTSIVFNIGLEWELDDGTTVESFVEPENAVGMPAVRPKKVTSIDFVDRPAANNGLFNENENTENEKMTIKELSEKNEELKTQFDAITAEKVELESKVSELEAKQSELSEVETKKTEIETELSEVKENADKVGVQLSESMEKVETLEAELSEVKKENEIYQKIFKGVAPIQEPTNSDEGKSKAELKEEKLKEFMAKNPDLSKSSAILKFGRLHPEFYQD